MNVCWYLLPLKTAFFLLLSDAENMAIFVSLIFCGDIVYCWS
ncbi:hypothetical protein PROVRUST_05920 [Providencia rustigianii DSM 4541]|uniref:Uncharacterized protein n=1 Tax=Providencia rustigianii DSM 4541 TaxID=500637 RepID=D1P0C3_9GAMM|nr:hypothetical protein PROVRUST_05920 [Providencia rustigianii DSM 4541]